MFSASATGHVNLLAHGTAGAMNTNRSVSFCNAGAIGEIPEATARKVDCGQRFAIVGPYVFEKGVEAVTNLIVSFWRWYRKLLEVGKYSGQFLWVPTGVPEVIDN
jgi:hypothetical protein